MAQSIFNLNPECQEITRVEDEVRLWRS